MTSRVVSLKIKTAEGLYQLNRVRTEDKLTLPKCSLDGKTISGYDHLKNIPLQTFEGHPAILIGQDNLHLIRKIREGKDNEPVTSLTKFGWVLHGFSTSVRKKTIPNLTCHLSSEDDVKLHIPIENFLHIGSIGVRNSEQPKLKNELQCNTLDTKFKKIDTHWETALPWRNDEVQHPDNKKNKGPDFLRLPEDAWTKLTIQPNTEQENNENHHELVLAVKLVGPLLDHRRFSNWRLLVSV
jgi:hypothetical protein